MIKPSFNISKIVKIINNQETIVYDSQFNTNAILLLNSLKHTEPRIYQPLSDYLNKNNPNSFGKMTTKSLNKDINYLK
jgi:hypothetical protein